VFVVQFLRSLPSSLLDWLEGVKRGLFIELILFKLFKRPRSHTLLAVLPREVQIQMKEFVA
jgi:hypothetical protein